MCIYVYIYICEKKFTPPHFYHPGHISASWGQNTAKLFKNSTDLDVSRQGASISGVYFFATLLKSGIILFGS
jgi:hypothetical protein